MNLRHSQASITLDLMRALAAQAVCVGHAIGLFGVVTWAQPPHVPYMQNVAVLVFFLLSGFLIAYTLDTKSADPSYGFRDYLIDRFARIYSALIPALLVIALIDFVWTTASGETRSTFTARNFIGSALMLNDVAGPLSRLAFKSFGTAGQLWTLAIEWHIYVLAGALFFMRRSLWMPLVAIVFCTVPIAYLRKAPGQDFGHGVTALWIAGFTIYYLLPRLVRLPMWLKAGTALCATLVYLAVVRPEFEFDRNSYIPLIIAFGAVACVAASLKASAWRATRLVRFMAAYSFTLYLVHNSLVKAIAKLWTGDPYLAAAVSIIAANLLAIAIAMPTEMRHRQFAAYLGRLPGLGLKRIRGSAASSAR